jgi:hypothetical protein
MFVFDLFSIGHSNIPAERFVALLRQTGASTLADVRSTPFSSFCPWFSGKNLAPTLARDGIEYRFFGKELGGGRATPPSIVTASPTMRRWLSGTNSASVSIASSPMRDIGAYA